MNDRQILLKMALKATEQFSKRYYPDDLDKEKYTEEDRELAILIYNTGYNGMKRIIEIITKRKIPEIQNTTVQFLSFCVVVPLGPSGGHNYITGEIILQWPPYIDQFVRQDGSLGNHMTTQSISMRTAKPQEIEKFINELPEAIITNFREAVHRKAKE